LWYIIRAEIAVAPQLWIKREGIHEITRSGAQWEYRRGPSAIETNEVFVVSTVDKSDYMVVLVHEGNQENPVVLGKCLMIRKTLTLILGIVFADLPKGGKPGQFPCCNPSCRDLEQHLGRVWPGHLVERALRFSRPEDTNILVSRFDNTIFDDKTNDLYVKCRRVL
jgi:hypothetical protein